MATLDPNVVTPELLLPLFQGLSEFGDLSKALEALLTKKVDVDLATSTAPSRDDFRRSVIIRFFNHTEATDIILPNISKMVAVWNDGDFDINLVNVDTTIRVLPNTAVWIFVTGVGEGVRLAPLGPAGDTIEAHIIPYTTSTPYTTVGAALDFLLYVAPAILGFTNNRGTLEIGQTVNSIHLSWAYNKTMTSASLNNSIGVIDPAFNSYDITGLTLTGDLTYTLTASDGTNTVNASTSILFRRKRYWGVSASTSLDDAGILALGGSEFATNFNKAVSYDATGGKYPYYAYPATFGVPASVTVGGLAFSDFDTATQSFTNASGHTESYHVLRFNNIQSGANIQVVWQ